MVEEVPPPVTEEKDVKQELPAEEIQKVKTEPKAEAEPEVAEAVVEE